MESKKIIALAIMGFVGGATTAVLEGSASAYFVNAHASICSPRTDSSPSFMYGNHNSDDSRLHNTDSSSVAYFICPVPNNKDMPKESIEAITVRVYDGSTTNSVSAKACTVDNSGSGGACGAADSSGSTVSFVGYNTLSLSVTALNDDVLDRAYLWVVLPPDAGDESELLGMYFRDAVN